MFNPLFFFIPLSLVIYLFTLWRKLKGEYPEKSIIYYSLLTGLTFILAGLLVFAFGGGDYFFPVGSIGLVIISLLLSRVNKWNSWYLLETTMPAGLLSILSLLLGMGLTFGKITYFIHALFVFISYLLARLWSGYRSFSWYHSGKSGFLFLAPLAIVFLLESGLDFYLGNGLYWRSLLMGLSSLGLGITIFIRSKKK